MGIIEEKMETTIAGYVGFRVWGFCKPVALGAPYPAACGTAGFFPWVSVVCALKTPEHRMTSSQQCSKLSSLLSPVVKGLFNEWKDIKLQQSDTGHPKARYSRARPPKPAKRYRAS